jgi:hypothetical protein
MAAWTGALRPKARAGDAIAEKARRFFLRRFWSGHPRGIDVVDKLVARTSVGARAGPWVCIDCGSCPDETLDEPAHHWRKHPDHRLAMFNVIVRRIEELD